MLQKLILWTFASTIIALLAACSSNPATSPDDPAKTQLPSDQQEAQFSGFLRDYTKLQPVADDDALRWVDPNADIAAYDKILLERIQVTLKDSSDYKAVDPTELKALVDYFHQALVRELGEAYPIVSVSGPGVLRVRIAITNLVPTQKS